MISQLKMPLTPQTITGYCATFLLKSTSLILHWKDVDGRREF